MTTEDTFFSYEQGTFSRTDHMLGHKTSLNKHKEMEIIPSVFSNHNEMKLKFSNTQKLGNEQIRGN